MSNAIETKGTVVTGVIGDDVHVVGVRILEYALGQAGFKVVPLGSQVSQKEFVGGAIETNADAILISSLSGHAEATRPRTEREVHRGRVETTYFFISAATCLSAKRHGKVLRRSLRKWVLTGSIRRVHRRHGQLKIWKRIFRPGGGSNGYQE